MWPDLSSLSTEWAPTGSKRTILLWRTKALMVGRPTGARNRRREEEEGGREKKRENGARPLFGREEAQEGEERERRALKGSLNGGSGGHRSNKAAGELSNKTPARVGVLNQNAHLCRRSIRKLSQRLRVNAPPGVGILSTECLLLQARS